MTVEELLNSSPSSLRVFIVRHGQTDWNNKKILQGHADISLNEEGLEQAKLIASRLKDFEIDTFITSDLKRCLQTIGEITKYHEDKDLFEIRQTKNLRERFMGPVEGMYLKDAIAKYGADSFKDMGESRKELINRLNSEWNSILTESFEKNHKNILICTHGGVITNFINYLYYDKEFKLDDSLKPENLKVPYNTSLTVVDVKKDDFNDGLIKMFACTKHLGAQLEMLDQQLR